MRVLRWIAMGLGGIVAVVVVLAFAARFGDGPTFVFPGGPLESGELVGEPVADWSFAADVGEVELQLLEPPRSRITWIVVHEGAAYIPCGFIAVPGFKRWPHQAMRDGRAVVRIRGRRYPVDLVRVTEAQTYAVVLKRNAEKYGYGSGEPDPAGSWIFRMESRSP